MLARDAKAAAGRKNGGSVAAAAAILCAPGQNEKVTCPPTMLTLLL
jgi:hypothetical protein